MYDVSSIFSPFTAILDSCLGQSSSDHLNISQHPLYIPFRLDQPIDYESIQWQTDSSTPACFVVQPLSSNRILQPRNELINDNNPNTIALDDRNYVDGVGDNENKIPEVTIKKKGKKKKQQQQIVTNSDATTQLNTSSNRTSSAGHKFQVNILLLNLIHSIVFQQKLSSKWSSGKRISAIGTGAIRKVNETKKKRFLTKRKFELFID